RHHIHIEVSRHCRSLSCVSWSDSQTRRERHDNAEVATPAPAKPVAAAPACPPVAAPAATMPAATMPAAPATAAPPSTPAPGTQPAPAPVRVQIAPAPVVPAPASPVRPAVQPPVKPARVVQAPAPSTIELAAANAQPVMKEKATVEATVTDKAFETPDWAKDPK